MNFTIEGEWIELCQLLKACNLCESGGAAKTLIQGGLVLVDGSVEQRRRKKIYPGQTVLCKDICITTK
ncbi:RNA-binding S4 domain-containing protein [Chitinivibrio alkaliphilus]|uniref:RNA-binding S4 domain-containing protein n=1 Tax=Chitinivibrio alkaliphilus ACht1 TaxID=1313304 RepID=U7D504_9BACT|nr:RNA-binding S4 domain-containing protein [Chitinivibrio alkaliphilus]ERP31599.1 RNA-binding S4 domain-containing protein [Chitinivibrio alkaliphilus ACht1]